MSLPPALQARLDLMRTEIRQATPNVLTPLNAELPRQGRSHIDAALELVKQDEVIWKAANALSTSLADFACTARGDAAKAKALDAVDTFAAVLERAEPSSIALALGLGWTPPTP